MKSLLKSLGVCAAVAVLLTGRAATAQTSTRGFNQVARVDVTGEERNRQRDLWVLEVHMKPMRMLWADVTDPGTGRSSRQEVWYLVYRAASRPVSADREGDTEPINALDPVPDRPKFIPEFTLIVYGDPQFEIPEHVYLDEVLPEALAEINRVESRRDDEPTLKDSVSVVQDVPEPAEDDRSAEWIYGVAAWRNVDPETDFFTVILGGFSNGYEVRPGPNGEPTTWRKVLVQKFTRLGDRFDPNLFEFRFAGPPQWDYQPDGGQALSVPARTASRP